MTDFILNKYVKIVNMEVKLQKRDFGSCNIGSSMLAGIMLSFNGFRVVF